MVCLQKKSAQNADLENQFVYAILINLQKIRQNNMETALNLTPVADLHPSLAAHEQIPGITQGFVQGEQITKPADRLSNLAFNVKTERWEINNQEGLKIGELSQETSSDGERKKTVRKFENNDKTDIREVIILQEKPKFADFIPTVDIEVSQNGIPTKKIEKKVNWGWNVTYEVTKYGQPGQPDIVETYDRDGNRTRITEIHNQKLKDQVRPAKTVDKFFTPGQDLPRRKITTTFRYDGKDREVGRYILTIDDEKGQRGKSTEDVQVQWSADGTDHSRIERRVENFYPTVDAVDADCSVYTQQKYDEDSRPWNKIEVVSRFEPGKPASIQKTVSLKDHLRRDYAEEVYVIDPATNIERMKHATLFTYVGTDPDSIPVGKSFYDFDAHKTYHYLPRKPGEDFIDPAQGEDRAWSLISVDTIPTMPFPPPVNPIA